MQFFPREKGKTAFSKKTLFEKAVFPFSRGKNRISQGVEDRGSLISVPLALREVGKELAPCKTRNTTALKKKREQAYIEHTHDKRTFSIFGVFLPDFARGAVFLFSTRVGDREGTPKNLCDKDFVELSGELSGAICLKTFCYWVVPSNCSEKSLVLFARVFWLWGSFLALNRGPSFSQQKGPCFDPLFKLERVSFSSPDSMLVISGTT